MTLNDFLDTFIEAEDASSSVGYLAQTKLFDQIPELRKDIRTPVYCSLGANSKRKNENNSVVCVCVCACAVRSLLIALQDMRRL
jgi:hypothetical protein